MARSTLSRRGIVIATFGALAGCAGVGQDGSTPTTTDNPAVGDVTQRGELTLESPAFEHGGEIPREYGHQERNVNPPLQITGIPPESSSLTLIMDDPDAVDPAGKVWLHWLVWDIPPSITEIPEGWSASDASVGTNDFGERGYGGPDPPDSVHIYRFKLYALDTTLDVSASADKPTVGRAMTGHVLAQTQLEGTYAP